MRYSASRRAFARPMALVAVSGLIGTQISPTCLPSSLLNSEPVVENQTGRELTSEELAQIIASGQSGVNVVLLSPLPGPAGPQGPVGPAGLSAFVGEVRMFAGRKDRLPPGWLLCDGQELSRTDYPALFDTLGDTYGPGDGTTTFNLPNYVDRSPMGAGIADAAGAPLTTVDDANGRRYGGKAAHTLTLAQMPAHAHDISHTHDLVAGPLLRGVLHHFRRAVATRYSVLRRPGAAIPAGSIVLITASISNNRHWQAPLSFHQGGAPCPLPSSNACSCSSMP